MNEDTKTQQPAPYEPPVFQKQERIENIAEGTSQGSLFTPHGTPIGVPTTRPN